MRHGKTTKDDPTAAKKTAIATDPQPDSRSGSFEEPRPSESEALRTELVQTQQELVDYKGKWQRSMADFDNYRKRVTRERKLDRLRGQANLMGQLLEVLDTFDKALEVEYETVEQAGEGMVRILTQFTRTLSKAGLEPVPSVGQPFDSRRHEALTTIESDDVAPDMVAEELVRGYTLKGELLRPAKVIVAKAPAKASKELALQETTPEKAKQTEDTSKQDS